MMAVLLTMQFIAAVLVSGRDRNQQELAELMPGIELAF